jgi:hypothetical protein
MTGHVGKMHRSRQGSSSLDPKYAAARQVVPPAMWSFICAYEQDAVVAAGGLKIGQWVLTVPQMVIGRAAPLRALFQSVCFNRPWSSSAVRRYV